MKTISLSDGEWKIMELLWTQPPHTIMQLVAALHRQTGWAKATVITMLGRLEAKGAVRHEQNGRTKAFYPAIGREEVAARETESFLEKVYAGSVGLMVNAMVERGTLSKAEIDDLYEILKRAEEGST